MKLQINNKTRLKETEKKFSEEYPYLKIDFFKKQHAEKELSSAKDKISPKKIISELGNLRSAESIDINGQKTVDELEVESTANWVLPCRYHAVLETIWTETSQTDNRTLEMQNEQGKMASSSTQKDSFIEQDFER